MVSFSCEPSFLIQARNTFPVAAKFLVNFLVVSPIVIKIFGMLIELAEFDTLLKRLNSILVKDKNQYEDQINECAVKPDFILKQFMFRIKNFTHKRPIFDFIVKCLSISELPVPK